MGQLELGRLAQQVDAALLKLDRLQLRQLYQQSGMTPLAFAEELLVPVLHDIGERWHRGVLSLAQVYMGGKICEELLLELLPEGLEKAWNGPRVALVVLEDFHVLGKQLVASVLKTAGIPFSDYGPMGLEPLTERLRTEQVDILLISTLMLASALRIKKLKERLQSAGVSIRLVVGGGTVPL
jgi:methanogenic corrinoid protein MtbC1